MTVIKRTLLYMRNKFILVFIILLLLFYANAALAIEIVKDINFDSKNAEVSYKLTRPALVRISLGVKEGPVFATLVDWKPKRPGFHKEKWANTGIKEIDNILCNKNTYFTFNYISFGRGWEGIDINSILEEETIIGPIGRSSGGINLNSFHKGHKRELCKEPGVNIILPEGLAKTKEGIPIVDRPIFLTVEIRPEDKKWFGRERYSLYMFVDAIFAHGLLDGFSPYHWRFDPTRLNKGTHLITVNLRGFNDHIGIASIPVYVELKNEKI